MIKNISSEKKSKRLRILLASLSSLLILLTARKVVLLSQDPKEEKDCLPEPAAGQETSAVTVPSFDPSVPLTNRRGTINDASCLNRTQVYGVVTVRNVEDIRNAVISAAQNNLKVSVAGMKHSMGGQAFAPNAVVLDMTNFKQVTINKDTKTLTAQSGATWHQIQEELNPHHLAIKAMQAIDIFTLGGSLSVNGHGADHNTGSIASTVKSLSLITADGKLHKLSPSQNPRLFKAVLGGYGLFGVIVDVELELVDDEMYNRRREIVDYRDFPKIYEDDIKNNPKYGLMYTVFSVAPKSFLKELMINYFERDSNYPPPAVALKEPSSTKVSRFFLNYAKTGPFGRSVKWFMQKHVQPRFESCQVVRSQALTEGEACLISRNQQMHDPQYFLKNNLKNDTDVLREYFVPRGQLPQFIDGAREIIIRNKMTLLHAGVRVVHKEDIMLNYAPQDMFATVFYFNQPATHEGSEKMAQATREMIDLATKLGGTFYLPYQLDYEKSQLTKAYPNLEDFFALKKSYDPKSLFINKFYEKYGGTKAL